MKKLYSVFTTLALVSMIASPMAAMATDTGSATTGLTRGTGGGTAPIIKAKWEMYTGTQGQDQLPAANAQFMPPGVWNQTLNYTVCAIATDPNGVSTLAGVYADIYYPTGVAYSEPVPSIDEHKTVLPDLGVGACGAFKEQNTLVRMEKMAGYNLFCDSIKNNNTNLPKFYSSYNFAEICAQDGELMKEEAYVYCDPKTLKWEDPAGLYTVKVNAQDSSGNNSNVLVNTFEYLPLTGFEKDFTNVDYGQVMLGSLGDEHKKISGDLNFGTPNNPTIRNTGNTRLYMSVAQDDMSLGQSSGVWNVQYDARVGNHVNDWVVYSPFGFETTPPTAPTSQQYTQLEDILELSEVEEMDFSILITKWPDAATSYSGNIWLKAGFADFRTCGTI